jgi:hypothetical protein
MRRSRLPTESYLCTHIYVAYPIRLDGEGMDRQLAQG